MSKAKLSSEFISSELARNFKLAKIMKDLLDNYSYEVPDFNNISSVYSIFFDLAKLFNSKYDESELIFLAKIIYSISGLDEALNYLAKYFNFSIELDLENNLIIVNYTGVDNTIKTNNILFTMIKEILFLKLQNNYEPITIKINDINFSINIVNKINTLTEQSFTDLVTLFFSKDSFILGG